MGGRGFYRVAFSASGRLLAAGGRGQEVHLFDLSTTKEVWRHSCDGSLYGLAFHGDELLVTGDGSGTALVWEVNALLGPRSRPSAAVSADRLESLWADLASDDAPALTRRSDSCSGPQNRSSSSWQDGCGPLSLKSKRRSGLTA